MVLLDTHALIWWMTNVKRLSKKARSMIEEESKKGSVVISAISIWEIAMLVKKGKVAFSVDPELFLDHLESEIQVKILPVSARIARLSVSLPHADHNDPADRMIVATAMVYRAVLVTKDKKIRQWKDAETAW